MNAVARAAQPGWACLSGVIANGDDQVEVGALEHVEMLRLTLMLNADLPQRGDGERVHVALGVRASAKGAPLVGEAVVDNGLRQLAAAAISGTKEEYFFHIYPRY